MEKENRKFLKELTKWIAIIFLVIWIVALFIKGLDSAYWFMIGTAFFTILRILLGDKDED